MCTIYPIVSCDFLVRCLLLIVCFVLLNHMYVLLNYCIDFPVHYTQIFSQYMFYHLTKNYYYGESHSLMVRTDRVCHF